MDWQHMTADRRSRVRGRLVARTLLTTGAVLVAVATGLDVSSALGGGAPSGGVVVKGHPSLVSYHAIRANVTAAANNDLSFTIAGNASQVLYPNKSSTIDLAFTNPSDTAIPLPAGAIKITITSSKPTTCPVSSNFKLVQTVTTTITIPPHATGASLSEMHVTPKYWPSISMETTTSNQDACEGMKLTLTYSATVASTQSTTGATSRAGSSSASGSQSSGSGPSPVPVHTATASSTGALAFTGFDVLLFGGSGALLIVLGLGLLMWRRRFNALPYSDPVAGGDDDGD